MDVFLSYNNNETILTFPVVPPDLHQSSDQDNSEFESINGQMQTIGTLKLKSIEISSIFPNKQYKWMRPGSVADGWHYVNTIQNARKRYIPFRLIILNNSGNEILNMACSIDNFNYAVDKAGDIAYTLSFKEYRFANYKR
jgi:hypothetical protein